MSSQSKNSKSPRSVRPPLAERLTLSAVRALVRAASALVPDAVESKAAEMFSTPRRAKRRLTQPAPHTEIPFRGGKLAFWSEGPANAPCVLLVHGWEADSSQLLPLVAPLRARGFRVARFDQPAHGFSLGSRASVVDFRDAVIAVAERLGPLHGLIGHSLGATSATLALATERISALRVVLIAPAREPRLFLGRIADTLALSPARRQGMFERVRAQVGDFDALDVSKLAPLRHEPLLVVHAQNDRLIPFEEGRAIASAWPQAQLLAPERLGHRKLLEDPNIIERAVSFVASAELEIRVA